MKRYSIAPSSARKSTIRKSTIDDDDQKLMATMELEKLEQQVTSVLQDIDENLQKSNAVINDKIFPIIRKYSKASDDVWRNVNYWKYFFEQSMNVSLDTHEEAAEELQQFSNKNLILDESTATKDKKNDENKDDEIRRDPSFKKPLLKGHIEESTPTWSTDHPKKLVSSTPQVNIKTFPKFDSTDSSNIFPPQMTTSKTRSPGKDETVTLTMRRSLNKYQRLTVSPKKFETPKTEEAKRRSSMIQELYSSPTLPKPPELSSGNFISSDYPVESSSNDKPPREFNRSPLLSEGIQRFPTTPLHGIESVSNKSSRRTSHIKTPVEIRRQYQDDDSDIHPPIPNKDETAPDEDENDDDVRFSDDLDTLELEKKSQLVRKRKLNEEKQEENIFIEEKTTQSGGSTLFHSFMSNEKVESRENTGSRSISNLFEDIIPQKDHSHEINSSAEMGQELQDKLNKLRGK